MKELFHFILYAGCEARCPLKKFTSLFDGNIPDDWHAECYGGDVNNWLRDNGE
jgi:hypothetical protein